MNKNITKTILASTVIAVGLLITAQNQSANAFSYEWKGLEIAKKEADQAKKDDERADRLMKEAVEK
ncbi:formyl peptide receptor-like 1 inhibitory protein, partial [Staphylococcus aureus]|nr:formyl peptide receptor-like 1 inhibitory protein [Staphylococcus aureus]